MRLVLPWNGYYTINFIITPPRKNPVFPEKFSFQILVYPLKS